MKKKKVLTVFIVIVLLVLCFLVGVFLTEKEYIKIFTTKNDEDTIKETKQEDESLEGLKYVMNFESNEYIYFTSDTKYEYVYSNIGENDYKTEEGTYTYSDNKIEFDNKNTAELKDNMLILTDNNSEDNDYNLKNIYFNEKTIVSDFKNINEKVTTYVKNMRENNNSLALVSTVETNINSCFIYKDNMSCSIDYSVYFDDSERYTEEECNLNEKFNTYSISSGACETNYVGNWSYFEFDLNTLKLNGTYTGL